MGQLGLQEILFLLFLLIIFVNGIFFVRYLIKLLQKRTDTEMVEINTEKPKSKNRFILLIVVAIIFLFVTLPFHYIFYKGGFDFFPKNEFTFSNTIITDTDIDNLINRYNRAGLIEKQALNSEPLVRKLREKGIIIEKSIFDSEK